MKSPISGPGRIRQLNRSAVLSHIRHNGKNSRAKIGKELGLSAAAITSVVSELIEENFLRKSDVSKTADSNKMQGRPISVLELNPNKASVFGVLLHPKANKCIIESAWADYTGNVFRLSEKIVVGIDNYQTIIDGIGEALSLVKQEIPTESKVSGLSIGIPGVVQNQTIPVAPKLKCIEAPEFITDLFNNFSFPISFENDVNLGAMSELALQPRLRDISFAYLHIYSGVGSSVALEGKILKGRRGWAGEIGQLKLKSNVEKRTSFEQLLSTDTILGDLLVSLDLPRNDLDSLVNYIENGDTTVSSIIEEYSNNLFNAINIIHNIIDLDEVIIDFPSISLIEKIIPQIENKISKFKHPLDISIVSMEHQAHLHGAALNALNLALENIEKRITNNKTH